MKSKVQASGIATTPAPGEVGVCESFPATDGWSVFEPNDPSAAIPDERFGNDIRDPTQRTES